jgi:hypothetical protein
MHYIQKSIASQEGFRRHINCNEVHGYASNRRWKDVNQGDRRNCVKQVARKCGHFRKKRIFSYCYDKAAPPPKYGPMTYKGQRKLNKCNKLCMKDKHCHGTAVKNKDCFHAIKNSVRSPNTTSPFNYTNYF